MIPSPPAITYIACAPPAAAAGMTVATVLAWTGHPRAEPSLQWRNGNRPIPGETASTYLLAADPVDLNCLVQIDNGRGTASAVALVDPIDAPPVVVEPPVGTYVVVGYVEEGYV